LLTIEAYKLVHHLFNYYTNGWLCIN